MAKSQGGHLQVKSGSRTVIWGTLIALSLVGLEWLSAVRFPDLHFPHGRDGLDFVLVTATLIFILMMMYRSLFNRLGYWLILGALLVAHIAIYASFFLRSAQGFSPARADMLYGAVGGLEVIVFALVMAKVYRKGPNTKFL